MIERVAHAHPCLTAVALTLAALEVLGICVIAAFAVVAHNGYNEPL